MCRASVEEVCGHDGGEVWVERHGDAAGVHVDAAAFVLVFIVAGLFVDDDVGEAEHVEEAFEVGGVCVEVDARVLEGDAVAREGLVAGGLHGECNADFGGVDLGRVGTRAEDAIEAQNWSGSQSAVCTAFVRSG